MKYFSVILLGLLAISTVMAQQPTAPPIYNQTFTAFSDTMTLKGGIRTSQWYTLPMVSDLAVFARSYDSAVVSISYAMRNSKTGLSADTSHLGTFVSTRDGLGDTAKVGTVALTTLVGYDQFRISMVPKTGHTAVASGKFKVYLYALARSGGPDGDAQGRRPIFNEATKMIDHVGYTNSTSTDTTQFMSLRGVSDLCLIVSPNDSANIKIYYQLKNNHTDLNYTGSWTQLGTDSLLFTAATPQRSAHLALSTILGYEQIRFYVVYGSSANSTDATSELKIYYYLVRRK